MISMPIVVSRYASSSRDNPITVETGPESLTGSRAVVARYWGELATSYVRLLSRCDAALKKSCLGCIEASWMIVVQRGPYLLSAR